MRVLSVNVGLPREVTWKGKPVRTGIYKEPVRGRVAVSTLNLAGEQALVGAAVVLASDGTPAGTNNPWRSRMLRSPGSCSRAWC
jgi:hypothetical protein